MEQPRQRQQQDNRPQHGPSLAFAQVRQGLPKVGGAKGQEQGRDEVGCGAQHLEGTVGQPGAERSDQIVGQFVGLGGDAGEIIAVKRKLGKQEQHRDRDQRHPNNVVKAA